MSDLSPDPLDEDFPEPPRLRALRRLVHILTVTLILGVLTVTAAFVIKLAKTDFGGARAPQVEAVALPAASAPLPGSIDLPSGERAVFAVPHAGGVAVTTIDADGAARLRIYDATGAATGAVAFTTTP